MIIHRRNKCRKPISFGKRHAHIKYDPLVDVRDFKKEITEIKKWYGRGDLYNFPLLDILNITVRLLHGFEKQGIHTVGDFYQIYKQRCGLESSIMSWENCGNKCVQDLECELNKNLAWKRILELINNIEYTI